VVETSKTEGSGRSVVWADLKTQSAHQNNKSPIQRREFLGADCDHGSSHGCALGRAVMARIVAVVGC
jgi:hypothetical protein